MSATTDGPAEKVIIVSGDGHIGAAPETYRPYLEAKYRDRIDDLAREDEEFHGPLGGRTIRRLQPEDVEIVDDQGAIRADGELGCWDVQTQLRELDREGVAAAILHGGHQCAILPFFSVMNAPHPPDLRAAGVRAYHRWAADMISAAPDRLYGVADPGPCLDLDETVRELEWVRAHGFRSVSLVQQTWNDDLPPVQDAYYEPYYAACADLGLVVSVHAGWGNPQGKFQEFSKKFAALVVGSDPTKDQLKASMMMEELDKADDSPLKLDMGPRRALWQLMLGGVFDRHPSLTFCLTEVRADWVPPTIAALDHLYATHDTPLTRKPSEYFARQCFVTPSSIHQCEVEMRHDIGVDRMMFGTDYPHPEGTWPNTRDWIGLAFAGVPEAEARAILGENAIRAYGLDRAALAAVADRIGPDASDLFGREVTVPEGRVANWDTRAGYRRGPENTDTSIVTELFIEDLATVR